MDSVADKLDKTHSRKEGEQKTLEHVVRAMVANGSAIEQIAKMAQIPLERLQKLLGP